MRGKSPKKALSTSAAAPGTHILSGKMTLEHLLEMGPRELRCLNTNQLREAAAIFRTETNRDRKENAIKYYKPNSPAALEFHTSESQTVAAGGGNRSGKTEGMLVEMIACCTGIFPNSLKDHVDIGKKWRGPINCRVVVESLTTTLYPTILPKLMWNQWVGIDEQWGERGHFGWIPRYSLLHGSWKQSWDTKLRILRMHCRDPDTMEIVGQSTVQFMCLRDDQLVYMPDHTWMPISEINVGDRLVDGEGAPCKVTETFHYEDAPVFRIRAGGGIDINATPNHLHFMADGSQLQTEELGVGDRLMVADTFRNEGKKNLKDWELGWMAIGIGDGCLTGKQFGFSARDGGRVMSDLPPLPENCKLKSYGYDYTDSGGQSIENKTHYVTLKRSRRDNPVIAMFREHGLWGLKSHDKFVPDEVFRQDIRGRALFVHHLWNTDGTVNEDGRQAVFVSTSKRLAGGVRRLLWSLGIPAAHGEGCYWSEFAGRDVCRYMTRISGSAFDRFTDMVTGLRPGPWPEAKVRNHGVIQSVERVEDAGVSCVSVDSARYEFVAEGVVTHNSKDQDPQDFASGEFHIVAHDEPPTEAIWVENNFRTMSVGGRMLLAMTWYDDPAIQVDYLYDNIYEPGIDPNVTDITWVNYWTVDNPNLDQAAIAVMESKHSDEINAVRLRGQPIRFSGRIHGGFQPHTQHWCFTCHKSVTIVDGECFDCKGENHTHYSHVHEFDHNPGWPVVYVLDMHPRKPHMMSWWTVTPEDDLWCVAEWEELGDPISCRESMNEIEGDLHLDVVQWLCDPKMGAQNASHTRETTWQQAFNDALIPVELADPSGVGIETINHLLNPDPKTRRPRMLWHPRCENNIQHFSRFAWANFKRALEKEQNQRPGEKYSDYPAIARYLVNSNPTFDFLTIRDHMIRKVGEHRIDNYRGKRTQPTPQATWQRGQV